MAGRKYERLDIVPFGRGLFETNDLDPVYVALHQVQWHFNTLSKWLIAYWCLYSCGAASYLAEHTDASFWNLLKIAAKNSLEAPIGGRWPRGAERRYWRGQQAIDSAEDLSTWSSPEKILEHFLTGPMDFPSVAGRVRQLRGFGPWISFKICDMLDRVLERPVKFNAAALCMFKDPVQAALMQWQLMYPSPSSTRTVPVQEAVQTVVDILMGQFEDYTAPPRHERQVGLQEVETVLCKWKSHMHGHYPLGKDTHEINEGLQAWLPHSDYAVEFHTHLPKGKKHGQAADGPLAGP